MMPCYWSWHLHTLWFSSLSIGLWLDSGMICRVGLLTPNLMSQEDLSVSQRLVLTSKGRHRLLSPCVWSCQNYHPSLQALDTREGSLSSWYHAVQNLPSTILGQNHTTKQQEATHTEQGLCEGAQPWGRTQCRDCVLSSCLGVHTFQMVLCALG